MCGTFGCLLERGQERARDRLVEFMSQLARNHDCEAEGSTSQPVRLTMACLHLIKIHRYKYWMFVLLEGAYWASVSERDMRPRARLLRCQALYFLCFVRYMSIGRGVRLEYSPLTEVFVNTTSNFI